MIVNDGFAMVKQWLNINLKHININPIINRREPSVTAMNY